MSVATIWVVVEPANGSLTSTSLELLTSEVPRLYGVGHHLG